MSNTKDIDLLNSPVKMLLVAPNGLGKSIAAASFYKAGPIHIDDSDIRLKPVKAYYPDADISYDSWTSDNFNGFVTKINRIIDREYKPKEKTWVIDSTTGFSMAAITYQLKVKDKVKLTKGGLPTTSWDEINGETVLFHNMLEAANVMYDIHKVNIIFTAHPIPKMEIIKDEEAKRIMSLVAYGNKVPAIIPGFFDEIYNLQMMKTDLKGGYKRLAYTIPMENLPGKTALYNYLPESFDITNKNFYDVWHNFLKPKV
jgi:hypothetical protein